MIFPKWPALCHIWEKSLQLSESRFTNKFNLSKRMTVRCRLSNERVQNTCLLLCGISQFIYLLMHSLNHSENFNRAPSICWAACWRQRENEESRIATPMDLQASTLKPNSLSAQGLKTSTCWSDVSLSLSPALRKGAFLCLK